MKKNLICKRCVVMYNLPNLLTISRIVVIPAIFLSVYITGKLWALLAAVLFIVASITDYFDGYLARAKGETSALGRLLDPIADKLLVTSALVVLLAKPDMVVTKLSFIPVIVILCREILVSGLREFLREVNVGMPVTRLAKWKTGFQMTALSMMLLKGFWYWGGIGELLLWVAGVLTFITGYQYFQKSLDYIRKEDKAKKLAAKKASTQQMALEQDSASKKLIAEIEAKHQRLLDVNKELISKVSTFFSNENSMESFMEYCNKFISEKVSADGCVILLADDYDNTLAVKSLAGAFPPPYKLPDDLPHKPIRVETNLRFATFNFSDNIFGDVFTSKEACLVADSVKDPRIFQNGPEDFLRCGSYIFIPIIHI